MIFGKSRVHRKSSGSPGRTPPPPATPAGASPTALQQAQAHATRVGSWMSSNKKLSLFGLWTIFLYVAAVYLYPEMRAWLLTAYGCGLLLLLLVMVALLVQLTDVFKESWLTVAVFALLTVAVVDPALMNQVPESFKARFGSWSNNRSAQVQAHAPVVLNNGCRPTAQHSLTFGMTPVNINPEGRCGPDLWFEGHCIYVQRARWTGDQTQYKSCGGTLPNDVELAWSADVPFTGAVALTPPRYR
jgi:hypothetical protein